MNAAISREPGEQRFNLGRSEELAEKMTQKITGIVAQGSDPERIRPMHDQVLVRVLDRESEEKLVGLLYVVATAKKDPRVKGLVIACGPGKVAKHGRGRLLMDVKPGDTVLIDFGAGALVNIGGVEHLMLSVDRIGAIVED